METLGTRLQAARTAKRTTLAQVAQAVGMSRSYLQQLEAGTSAPTVPKLQILAAYYGTTVGALLGEPEIADAAARGVYVALVNLVAVISAPQVDGVAVARALAQGRAICDAQAPTMGYGLDGPLRS